MRKAEWMVTKAPKEKPTSCKGCGSSEIFVQDDGTRCWCFACLKKRNAAKTARYRAKKCSPEYGLKSLLPKVCIDCDSTDVPTRELSTRCRECQDSANESRSRNWQINNPDKYRANYVGRWLVIMVRHAMKRADANGWEFNITVDDIVIPEACPYLGIKLEPGVGKIHPASPTLDRMDSSKGYIKGNVEIISHLANTIKNRGTAAQHEAVAARMRKLGLE